MADQYCNTDVLRFFLFEVHQVEDLFSYDRFVDYDRASVDLLLESFKSFADLELFPWYREMDSQGVQFEGGEVKIHPQIKTIIKKSAELGFIGSAFDYDQGGMQLPSTVHYAIQHMLDAANNHVNGYTTLTTGAARLILSFGTDELIEQFVPKMLATDWLGTMALTEPEAGSSLSDLSCSAIPRQDGSYDIVGQKIFISGGDHQFAENIIHLLLARIKGDPPGTKGISLFVVPKKRTDSEGALISNDVYTYAEIEKLGQKGYATTQLVFGEHQNCRGWLLGERGKGLSYMFQMMNEARISVGVTAASMATAAYYASLQYANERKQGRPFQSSGKKNVAQEPCLIIEHPDVRRMLLLQKAITEGSLSLVLECARLHDLTLVEDGEKKTEAWLLLELLTPVVKAYASEMGSRSISQGLQVLGGYGYTMDFPLQQYYRDVRITSIYEGTTGIQSLDLLGRKVLMDGGKALELFLKDVHSIIEEVNGQEELKPYGAKLLESLELLEKVTAHLGTFAKDGQFQRYLADATLYMDMFSRIVISWQWLKIATLQREHQRQRSDPSPSRVLVRPSGRDGAQGDRAHRCARQPWATVCRPTLVRSSQQSLRDRP